jgi:hypothetical protein
MDAKTLAIAVLAVTAILLVGIVASGLGPGHQAYGQGGVYSTYIALAAQVQESQTQFIIADTANRRVIFYQYNPTDKTLAPVDGVELVNDFKRKLP